MDINFLYCIDYPAKSDNIENTAKIVGWLLCSCKLFSLKMADEIKPNISFVYGLPRPDVHDSFKTFSNNVTGGFSITTFNELINRNEKFVLQAEVEISQEQYRKVKVVLDLNTNTIQDYDVEDETAVSETKWNIIEKQFIDTLMRHPWLTVRMDITNKCNLRCIMCHYKVKEFYAQPLKLITAEKLKYQLQDIAPYVKQIMISCAFEPLMSKHFAEIVGMLHKDFPHMEIALCTNGMLLNSVARKVIIENRVTNVILSFDGVTKTTLEKIRVGADYGKIISNIMALRDLKLKLHKTQPLLFMDFVLMNSNIHEAPYFVKLCKDLGVEMIDFRHLVGLPFFNIEDEMLTNQKVKYNYYRQRIVEESEKHHINIRLPEPFATNESYLPLAIHDIDYSDFLKVIPDLQTVEVLYRGEFSHKNGNKTDFEFLASAKCLRPFNEITINDHDKIMPCSYYGDFMGDFNEDNTLYSVFFSEKYRKVRRKKIQSGFDFKCISCPIKLNYLPTEINKS